MVNFKTMGIAGIFLLISFVFNSGYCLFITFIAFIVSLCQNNSQEKYFVCNKCKREVSESDEFCPDCGAKFNNNNIKCKKCKTSNSRNNRFCSKCGEKI